MTRYAISDIHGCLQTFEALLDRLAFSTQDELYLLGDSVDRGPDSKGVIDRIRQMQQEGYAVHCLRGNHEEMLLEEIKDDGKWFRSDSTLKSFGCKYSQEIPDEYRDFFENLHWYLEVDDYILVHAGLNFNIENPLDDRHEMVWIRYWYEKINRDWLGNRIIVHGHTPTNRDAIRLSLETLDEIPAINIDNGCVYHGLYLRHLCALDLTNRRLFFEPRIEED